MNKWIFRCYLAFILCISSAWATTNNDLNNAQHIIENWFAAMKDKQYTTAASYLAPQFTSLHTDGIVRNKQQEMELIKNLDMTSYHLSNFKFTQSDNNIVVTYKDDGVEKIDNKEIASKPAGRLAVLQNQKGKWLILAYANLDQIG